ncbi:hypothetical protein LXL04_028598 [Taraxacum kok-saghyz]
MANSYSCVWKDIVSSTAEIGDEGIKVINLIKAKLGNGEKLDFLTDAWNGDENYKDKYPQLYNLETEKDVKVARRLTSTGTNWNWRRAVREGWEKEELENLQSEIGTKTLSNEADRWWIHAAPGGIFSVRWYRGMLEKTTQEEDNFKYKWDRSIPIKANILNWRLTRGRVPVRVVLAKMGINPQSQFCPFCECDNRQTSTSRVNSFPMY